MRRKQLTDIELIKFYFDRYKKGLIKKRTLQKILSNMFSKGGYIEI